MFSFLLFKRDLKRSLSSKIPLGFYLIWPAAFYIGIKIDLLCQLGLVNLIFIWRATVAGFYTFIWIDILLIFFFILIFDINSIFFIRTCWSLKELKINSINNTAVEAEKSKGQNTNLTSLLLYGLGTTNTTLVDRVLIQVGQAYVCR